MNASRSLLETLYAGMLRLYPASFRAEFAEEMQGVFSQRVRAASVESRWITLLVILREFRDFPGSLIGEHLRAWRLVMSNLSLTESGEPPAPWWAILAVVFFIVVPGTIGYIPWSQFLSNNAMSILILVVVLGCLLGPLIAGIKAGLPRWSLFFAGTILGALGIYGVLSFIGLMIGRAIVALKDWLTGGSEELYARWWMEWINGGWFWLSITITILAFLLWLHTGKRSRKIADRIRSDWSQISFLFYGAVLITFAIDFDEYQYEGWYVLGCLLSLAAGAWAYLRIQHTGRRVLALLAGLTACMAIMGVGKFYLVPLQDWPIWSTWNPPEKERWFESLRAIASWSWAAAAVGLPGLLQMIRNRRAVVRSEVDQRLP